MSGPGSALDQLNQLERADDEEAIRRLLDCCGSRRWATAVARGRPYASALDLLAAAERELDRLESADWEEALAAHPRIGASASSGRQGATAVAWSVAEQAGAETADGTLRRSLADGNRRYEERFGRGYVVRASGRDAAEMLALLERRLGNDAAVELVEAIAQQREITRLRLDKMLAS